MGNSLSYEDSSAVRWLTDKGLSGLVRIVLDQRTSHCPISLYGAKLYLMDDGRWLILDYLNIPDAPRHHIDCMEGGVCNMNVRIVADSTKLEIERNQEMFDEPT